jgi:ABC-type antimicrobial peptide transport system permease subunit
VLSSVFAVMALLLVCVGLYGVVALDVVRRTHEIGIRMALGGRAGEVLWMVLKNCSLTLGIGLPAGVLATVIASRLIQNQLFGVSPSDPLAICTAAFVVGLVTLLAGYLPARGATKADPMVALRYD